MPVGIDIVGFQLPIKYKVPVEFTVKNVKLMVENHHDVPVGKQSLFLDSIPLLDDMTLAHYGMEDGVIGVKMELRVAADEGPIQVTLVSPQFPKWKATVHCREATTMGEFKRLAADELRWAETEGMEFVKGYHGTRLDREENLGRPVRDWLVIDGTSVNVLFTSNVPQNGHRPPGPKVM